MGDREIQWRAIPFAEGWEDYAPDVVILACVRNVDAAWRSTPEWIAPGGAGQQANRYDNFGDWFARGLPVEMCCISLSEGALTFINGRHRFAWLRDYRLKTIPVQVPAESAEEFSARFAVSDVPEEP